MISFPMLNELSSLLKRRLEIIADHSWRDRDPSAHLAALADVSEKINAWSTANRMHLDARLRHYLTNSSYQKALEYLSTLHEQESAN